MIFSVSTKTRGIGGASALAIIAGLAGGLTSPAFAQTASVAAIELANFDDAESECERDGNNVVCAPGVDFDGFFDESNDPLSLDVQEGALVLSTIGIVGPTNGTIDGEIVTEFAFEDALFFGSDSTLTITGLVQTLDDVSAGIAAEGTLALTNNGLVQTDGEDAIAVLTLANGSTVLNSGEIATSGAFSTGLLLGDDATVDNSGVIATLGEGSFAVALGNGGELTNAGLIGTSADFAFAIDMLDNGTVINSGTLETLGDEAIAINAGVGSAIESSGAIFTEGENAIAILAGAGSSVALGADSVIDTLGDNASGVVILGDGVVSNDGVISTAGSFAQGLTVLGDAQITNNGLIETAGAVALDIGGMANMMNGAQAAIIAGSDDAIRLSGDASTLVNRGIIDGEVAVFGGEGTQSVVNFGSLVSNSGDAVLLGNGADRFEHWTGATAAGNIDLESGDDTFILEGSSSSIIGTIFGGEGDDLAIIAGTLDADNFQGFEAFQIGTALGGTLNDAVVSGDRVLDGNVTIIGDVAFGLGDDSLTSTGSITLENGSTITVTTDRGVELVGQTVLILQEGTNFTDNGAQINIIDLDLLIDYVPVVGSLAIQVAAANPFELAGDVNLASFGGALQEAVALGTLSDANFAAFNALDADQLQSVAFDALPSLSNGAAREIFESSSATSEVLGRRLAAEGSGLWGEITARSAEQDATSSTSGGYDSDQLIFTLGGDITVGETGRIGLLVSYAELENDDLSAGMERGETDIESVKLGAYGSVEIGERGFANGEIAYLTGDIDSQRSGQLGTIGSSFNFDGFAYRFVAGYDLVAGDDLSVTPTIGINGAMIEFDDAVETGGFGFLIERDDSDFTELRGGLQVAGQLSDMISAFARGTYIYDLEDDVRASQLRSAELGDLTVALPEPEQDRYEVAAGLEIAASERFTIAVSYLGDFASGYDGHSARATMRIAF